MHRCHHHRRVSQVHREGQGECATADATLDDEARSSAAAHFFTHAHPRVRSRFVFVRRSLLRARAHPKALERRFQQVYIGEPSPEDTVSILRGLKARYEVHHGVRIRDEALLAAARLSSRYLPDRFLPDKAIDLVDEACAKLKNELSSKPTALDEIDRRIIQLEMEKLSLSSDRSAALDGKSSEANRARLSQLEDEIAALKIEQADLTERWTAEKGASEGVTELSEKIAQARFEIEKAEREYDLARAAELKYGTLPELEARLAAAKPLEEERSQGGGGGRGGGAGAAKLLRDEVVAEDIADVISAWTGIPASRMLDSEKSKVLAMGSKLRERVVGQDEAIDVVTQSIQRSRAGLNDPSKPIASLIFLGPTGVGKTELAKALSEFMFDTEDAMIRIDMSEYMEKHTVSRLLGAPPGYVGYDEGGQLTDAVRRRPYSVLLFDEMEKAHPDVFNVMLQMLDDGRVTDSKGRVVSFKNCVVIFTSNIGSQDIIDLEGVDNDLMKVRVYNAMKENVSSSSFVLRRSVAARRHFSCRTLEQNSSAPFHFGIVVFLRLVGADVASPFLTCLISAH